MKAYIVTMIIFQLIGCGASCHKKEVFLACTGLGFAIWGLAVLL